MSKSNPHYPQKANSIILSSSTIITSHRCCVPYCNPPDITATCHSDNIAVSCRCGNSKGITTESYHIVLPTQHHLHNILRNTSKNRHLAVISAITGAAFYLRSDISIAVILSLFTPRFYVSKSQVKEAD